MDGFHGEFQEGQPALKVKPQITPDGKVMMAIEVNKDQARYDQPVAGGNVPIDTKHVKTEVVVENGGTIVIRHSRPGGWK